MKEAHQAALEGRLADLKEMYRKDAKVVHEPDGDHRTCLHWSCSSGKTEVCNWLIDFCSVNVDVEDDTGWTPLHVASSAGWAPIVEKLVENGANVNKQNDCGCIPLHYAASKGHTRIAEILIEHGSFMDAVDSNCGETPLHRAAAKGQMSVVRVLLSKGASINFVDSYGDPPIVRAIESDHHEIISFMIKSGALINTKNKENVYVYQLIPTKVKEMLKTQNLYYV